MLQLELWMGNIMQSYVQYSSSSSSENQIRDRYVNKPSLDPFISRALWYTNKQLNLCLNAIYGVHIFSLKGCCVRYNNDTQALRRVILIVFV